MTEKLPKIDPFKPVQPRIPGVSDAPAAAKQPPALAQPDRVAAPESHSTPEPLPAKWIVAAITAAVVLVAAAALWNRKPTDQSEQEGTVPASLPGSALHAARAGPPLPAGPGPIATTEELAKPWSARKFLFRNSLTGEMAPAVVVRLPGGTYWALSLQEPFGTCELEYVTDLKKLHDEYGYAADHPMVADPCNRSVFDLLRYGSGPVGLVRGEVEQGPAIRPPMAIEVREEGQKIVAVRME